MARQTIVMLLRRAASLALVAAYVTLNLHIVDLHVHAADHGVGSHRHGPAFHHHDSPMPAPSGTLRVTAVDDDDTVVRLGLSAAAPGSPKPAGTVVREPLRLGLPSAATLVTGACVIARAHGPPSEGLRPLRAPPLALLI